MIFCIFLCIHFSVYASSLCSLVFFGSVELRHLLPLKFLFFFSFLASLSKMTQQEPTSAPPSDSNSISSSSPVLSTSLIPLPSASFYKSLYRWAPAALLEETSSFTSLDNIAAYRKKIDLS